MTFKEEVEKRFGRAYGSSEWWDMMANIMSTTLYDDIFESVRKYYITGDESMLTPKRRDFIIMYYGSLFR